MSVHGSMRLDGSGRSASRAMLFAMEYVRLGAARWREAIASAGYQVKSSGGMVSQRSRLLARPEVREYIATRSRAAAERAGVDAAYVRAVLAEICDRWRDGRAVGQGVVPSASEARAAAVDLGKDVGMWPDKLQLEHSLRSEPTTAAFLDKVGEALALKRRELEVKALPSYDANVIDAEIEKAPQDAGAPTPAGQAIAESGG